jgi:hypothetical protein
MNTYTQDGVLELADISGFTEFVTTTELEHGPQIIAALLLAARDLIRLYQVEGDADWGAISEILDEALPEVVPKMEPAASIAR